MWSKSFMNRGIGKTKSTLNYLHGKNKGKRSKPLPNHKDLSYCLIDEKNIRSLYDEISDNGKRSNFQRVREKGYTQEQLAEAADLLLSHLSKVESGG